MRINEEVIKRARFILWNAKEDAGDAIGEVGVLETLLNHHMVFLNDSRADKPFRVVLRLRTLVGGDLV